MDERTPKTSAGRPGVNMTYGERLANYEKEKMNIPRVAGDSKTYEQALRVLAKKWRI